MSAMYWGVNALYLMRGLDDEIPEILDFIKKCQQPDGGFSAAPQHDSHLLHTLSAVQILIILQKCDHEHIDVNKCVSYVKSLQQSNGSFSGDKWGEIDTRFSFCALATLKLLDRLDAIDVDSAIEFVMSCNNEIDGGFGSKPGSESHSAYVYCCVGSLAIANQLHRIDIEQLGTWLSQRQVSSGGLNGRPEKLPDLCYSWWCLSSLKMIDRMHLIDHQKLLNFILACQDEEQGGFSDRPGNWVDPYHTMFAVASISLMCEHYTKQIENDQSSDFLSKLGQLTKLLNPVNPVLCMPQNFSNTSISTPALSM